MSAYIDALVKRIAEHGPAKDPVVFEFDPLNGKWSARVRVGVLSNATCNHDSIQKAAQALASEVGVS